MTSWWRNAILLVFVGYVWLVLSALAATPRVQFIRPPAFVTDQELVTYYVRVPRHPDNRLLVVVALDAVSVVSEMRRDLHGERSPALWNVPWRLPAGEFSLVAAVFDAEREVGRDVRRLTVSAHGP